MNESEPEKTIGKSTNGEVKEVSPAKFLDELAGQNSNNLSQKPFLYPKNNIGIQNNIVSQNTVEIDGKLYDRQTGRLLSNLNNINNLNRNLSNLINAQNKSDFENSGTTTSEPRTPKEATSELQKQNTQTTSTNTHFFKSTFSIPNYVDIHTSTYPQNSSKRGRPKKYGGPTLDYHLRFPHELDQLFRQLYPGKAMSEYLIELAKTDLDHTQHKNMTLDEAIADIQEQLSDPNITVTHQNTLFQRLEILNAMLQEQKIAEQETAQRQEQANKTREDARKLRKQIGYEAYNELVKKFKYNGTIGTDEYYLALGEWLENNGS